MGKPVAIVTGATRGLGRDTAIFLAQRGFCVVVNYRKSTSLAEQTLSHVKKYSEGILIKADITKEADKLVKKTLQKYKRVDVLVNNVGDFVYKTFDRLSIEEWNRVMENNLTSVFAMTQSVLPAMRKKHFGRIINFAATGASHSVIRDRTVPYDLAKQSVLSLTQYLAKQEIRHGITINCISPGILETSLPGRKHTLPIGRRLSPKKDILPVIDLLLKQEAITGANIDVSGGWEP